MEHGKEEEPEDYQKVYRAIIINRIVNWDPKEEPDEILIRVYDAMRGIVRRPRRRKK